MNAKVNDNNYYNKSTDKVVWYIFAKNSQSNEANSR